MNALILPVTKIINTGNFPATATAVPAVKFATFVFVVIVVLVARCVPDMVVDAVAHRRYLLFARAAILSAFTCWHSRLLQYFVLGLSPTFCCPHPAHVNGCDFGSMYSAGRRVGSGSKGGFMVLPLAR